MRIFQVTTGTDPQLAVNETVGKTGYEQQDGGATAMVTRSVLFICSDIFDSDTRVSMELPAHPAFYLKCVGPDGDRNIRIEQDANLNVTVPANFQIQAQVAL